jgi:hypothetical protein
MRPDKMAVVVPWHNEEQLEAWKFHWNICIQPEWLILQQDKTKEGCAVTKNKGMLEAKERGFEGVVILDDDCLPYGVSLGEPLDWFRTQHAARLEIAQVPMFQKVTQPASRGTPYFNTSVPMPVAAVMGFWLGVGDYDACGQLVHGARTPMQFETDPIFGKYFPLCGMNLSFSLEWWPWCQFIDVSRWDDIWQGFLFQKEAYRRGFCFRLDGPYVNHSRQSNVWANLRDEAKYLENNETIWQSICTSPETEYGKLRALLPV